MAIKSEEINLPRSIQLSLYNPVTTEIRLDNHLVITNTKMTEVDTSKFKESKPGTSSTWGSKKSDTNVTTNSFIQTDNDDSLYYNMNHSNRGYALIFNHELFIDPKQLPRKGTEVDCTNLVRVLKGLGFYVSVFHDYSFSNICRILKFYSQIDHTYNDCILICVLSHGSECDLWAKDVSYSHEELWKDFTVERCPSLAFKPKIFLLQACRGSESDSGVKVISKEIGVYEGPDPPTINIHSEQVDSTVIQESFKRYNLPLDFLLCYPTSPGYYAWRHESTGTWFIQMLTKDLESENKEKRDFLTILTSVAQRVAYDCQSLNRRIEFHAKKQIPCITSTLQRLLFL